MTESGSIRNLGWLLLLLLLVLMLGRQTPPAVHSGPRGAGAEPAPEASPAVPEAAEVATPQPAPSAPKVLAAEPVAGLDDAATGNPEALAPKTEVALDADLLYDILAAEISLQRDQPQEAYPYYMAAARRASDPALAERATRAAIAAHAQTQAEEAAAFWVELAPDSLQARQVAAYVALEKSQTQGQVALALPYLRAVMEHSPQRRQGYLHCARLVARLDDPLARLELMGALIDEYGEDPDALLAMAGLAAGAERIELAHDYAVRAAAQRPAWNRPPLFLVQLLVNAGRAEDAIVELERYFSKGFDDLELRTLYAQLLIETEDYQGAREAFATLLESHPQMPGVLFAAGVLSLQLKDYAAARDYLLRLRETGERKQDAAFMLGEVEETAGQLEAARDWYAQVRGDKELDAQIRLASVEARLGQVSRTRERLQQLRDRFPEQQATLYLIEGEILREADQAPAAMALYDQALEHFGKNTDLLYARALLAAKLNQIDVLERDLRQVLSINPDHADALNALGYTLADQTDRLEEAQQFIARALELEPEQPAILDSMGWLLYRMGKPQEAESYLRKALDELSDGEIAAHLGEVLWALGRREEAQEVWQQALDEYPDHDYLRRVIERHPISLAPTTMGAGS